MKNKTEFENLQEENTRLRTALDETAFINHIKDKELKKFWININLLINNEIEQEKLCNN